MDQEAKFVIKLREKDKKRFSFLASGGRINDLRIHAVRFTKENALSAMADLRVSNPDFLFEVRHADTGRTLARSWVEQA
jgi:hypothetical protein